MCIIFIDMKKKITNFAIDLDENTKKQFEECSNLDFVVSASLMPDAHSGYVAPIGSVIVTKDYIVPAWVGYDIGCGMIACRFISKNIVNIVEKKSVEIFAKVNEKIPMGVGVDSSVNNISDKSKKDFKKLLDNFKERVYDKNILNVLNNSALKTLGSLGSGNHFIELGWKQKDKDELWLIIHSGSRGIGHRVATHYMKKSMISNIEDMKKTKSDEKVFEQTYPIKADSLLGLEYLNVLEFCLQFALLNRLEMAYSIREVLREALDDEKLEFGLWTNKNHNHVIFENGFFIHRKGATPAKKGERGVIPANMRDGSYLVEGLGNNDFLESSSHGAGRTLSRVQAKNKISMEEFMESMEGIVGKVDEKTLDESPQVYKNITNVMAAQAKSVNIVAHIKPIINWKG